MGPVMETENHSTKIMADAVTNLIRKLDYFQGILLANNQNDYNAYRILNTSNVLSLITNFPLHQCYIIAKKKQTTLFPFLLVYDT